MRVDSVGISNYNGSGNFLDYKVGFKLFFSDVKANSDNVRMIFETQAQFMISYRKKFTFFQS
jgi:hypothetical protein